MPAGCDRRTCARPHARLNGAIRGLGDQVPLDPASDISVNAAPAGGLAISANDMTRWLAVQLAHGALPGGGRLFSEAQSRQMWNPMVIEPIQPRPEPLRATQPMFDTYALGWDVQDYRGSRLIWHGGAVFGSLAAVALLPDRNVGIYIAVNSEEGEVVRGLMYELLDHYLGLPRDTWPEKLHAFRQERSAAAVAALQAPAAQPARIGPSLPLARYAGDYSDPWYGTITIRESGGQLNVEFPHAPGLTAMLEHYQYDSFRTRFNDPVGGAGLRHLPARRAGPCRPDHDAHGFPIADFSYDYQDLLFTPVAAGQ